MTAFVLNLTVLTAFAAPPSVTLRPLEGEAVHGQLTTLSAAAAQIRTAEKTRDLPTSQIMAVEFAPRTVVEKPAVWIDLLDGSKLLAIAYAAAEGKSRVTLVTGQDIELMTRSIHSVRFYAPSPELAVQWREITSSMASGDTLVIRKSSTRTVEQGEDEPRVITEQALDQVEGTVLEVTPATVLFQVDEEKVNVRREKLEGLIYYQPGRREPASPLCRLTDAGGTQWLLKEIELDGEQLAVATLGGLSIRVPLSDVAKIDFSLANVAFLGDLEAEAAGGAAVSLQPLAMAFKFDRIFQLRAAPPLGTDGFKMGGQRFENGVSLHSPARLHYRVPTGFRKFSAIAGVDDSILAPGKFSLVVLLDGTEAARHEFSDQNRKVQQLTIDVSRARRLTIELVPGDGQDIGDQLNLCDARFTK